MSTVKIWEITVWSELKWGTSPSYQKGSSFQPWPDCILYNISLSTRLKFPTIATGNAIQCAAALQTLQTIIDAMSQRFKPEHVVEILDFLFVFDRADEKLENLAELIIITMEQRKPSLNKELTMSLLVSCVTSRDTIEQNPIFSRLLSS